MKRTWIISKIGIVGSGEKGADVLDVSLAKFLSTGMVEVFCPASEFKDFSISAGIPVVLEKKRAPFLERGSYRGKNRCSEKYVYTERTCDNGRKEPCWGLHYQIIHRLACYRRNYRCHGKPCKIILKSISPKAVFS